MNLLNKLTIKSLKLNKKRTIVTIIGIILSVALITAVASIFMSGVRALQSFEKYRVGDYHLIFYDVDSNNIETFKNYRGISDVSITNGIGYANIDSKNEDKPYAYVLGYNKSSLEHISIRMIEGRLPENDNEIVIPDHLKTNGRVKYNVGDSITLDLGSRLISNHELSQQEQLMQDEKLSVNNKKTYTIVGIAERPSSKVEPMSAPGYTFITYIDDKDIKGNVNLYITINDKNVKNYIKILADFMEVDEDILRLAFSDNTISPEDEARINEALVKAKYTNIDANFNLIQLTINPLKMSGMKGLTVAAGVVIVIIVVTSVFCIKNSFDISITEKIKQYGMLRSVGATKKQIKKNVFYEATILGIIGIILGVIVGLLASFILIIISNYLLPELLMAGVELKFYISFIAIVAAILLGIITIYLSAFRAARKASLVSPIDSIRNSAELKIKAKNVKSPKYIKKIFGMGGEISYKNLKRNKKKYRTTVISIIVSVMIFITIFSFMNILFKEVQDEIQMSDYNLSVRSYDLDNMSKIKNVLKLDGIEEYSLVRRVDIIIPKNNFSKEYIEFMNIEDPDVNSSLQILTLGDGQYQKYIKSLGLNIDEMSKKGILLDYESIINRNNEKKYLRDFNFQVNDTITSDTFEESDKVSITVGYVTDKAPFGFSNYGNPYMIISDSLFDKLFKERSICIYIKTSDASKLQDDIDALLGKTVDYTVSNIDAEYRLLHNLYKLICIFIYGFVIVISLIGVSNMFNTITTNMELRKREFAMLKSVGMTKKEFNRMIRLESLFMGAKSLIIGVTLGCIFSFIIFNAIDEYTFELPYVGILIATVVVFSLIFIIMKYSIYKINKQNTIEVIRNENI